MINTVSTKPSANPGLITISEILSLTIPQMLERSVRLYGDLFAMRAFRNGAFKSITYRQLLEEVNGVAAGLSAQGIKPGDRVGILSENRPEWGIAYFAILKIGGITVPLDALLKPTEIRHILRESGAKSVVTSSKFLPDFISAEISAKKLEFLVSMNGETEIPGDSPLPIITYNDLKHAGSKISIKWYDGDINDTVALLFTSGTTGQSKGVMLTHHNILSDIKAILDLITFYTTDNFLSVLPIHHAFECTCGFLTPLTGGASITYARSLKSKELLEDISENHCTIMLGVPLLFEKMYSGLLRAIEKKPISTRIIFSTSMGAVKFIRKSLGYNAGGMVFKGLREKAGLSSLRLFVSGGAPLPPEVGQGFEHLGIKFIQGYGLTETSPVLTLNPPSKPIHASIGIAITGAILKIDRPDNNGVGEILAKGPMVMKGYYQNQDATRQVLSDDGWLHTGDSGYMDNEKYFYIVGRVKNLIVTRAGKNIYPEEIETLLIKSPYIAEALVMGRTGSDSDKQLVDSVEAVVVPDYEFLEQQAEQRGKEFSEDELNSIIKIEINRLCADIADYKRVKSFKMREDEFTKTSTKKIKRYLFIQPSVNVDNNSNHQGNPE